MEQYYKFFKLFISSPSDVAKERDFAEEALNNINDSVGDTLKTYLKVIRWEKLPPEYSEESIQENLNKLIKGCHFFILILNKRYGTVEKGYTKSNTEREIDTIIEEKINEPKKIVLSYFKKNANNNDQGPQELKVSELKERISKMGFVYRSYSNPNEFKELFYTDLFNVLLRMELSPQKKLALQKFWNIGRFERHIIPKLSIIYPPVPREMMTGIEEKDFWKTRLAPNIFFEDFKAIQKIKKTLQFIGFNNYGIYTNSGIPSNIGYHNAMYLCLPRQPRALLELEKYEDRRFSFTERQGKKHSVIKWISSEKEEIIIQSPLSKYLSLQRSSMDISYEWNHQLGNIFAKDFAVISRFSNKDTLKYVENTPLKEYFISGIRGLGTWGAAWYIDNMYKKFLEFDDNESIQILLEVAYKGESIEYIKDVSEFPSSYFENEMKPNIIKQHILDNMGKNAL